MKVTLFMAMSLNGLIARKNGEEDFLSHENWDSFSDLVTSFGNFIVGRKTYEAVQNWKEDYSFDDFRNAQRVIISKNKNYETAEGYFLAPNTKEALNLLEQKGFDKVLITGGSKLNSSFAKENLIDDVILNIEPIIVGEGISLFFNEDFELKLNLIKIKKLSNNLIQLHYKVIK